MRVAVLAMGWTGYNDAAFKALTRLGVEVLVITHATTPDTAFTTATVPAYAELHELPQEPDGAAIAARLRAFAPDAVLVHSWHLPYFRAALKALPAGTLKVLWMDNVWRNTPKQWVGRAVAPWWVRSLYDAVMVPSDRTEFFARRLGFGEGDVIRGSLSADTELFGSEPVDGAELRERARFIACLRLVEHKGADVLAEAYRRYRASSADSGDTPWELSVVGIGPLASSFEGIDGVTMHGFRQPADVAKLMRTASCLVVPSREEPYGVVLHEGAVSALPIVSTYFVGAAPQYVQDGQNGWTVPGDDVASLAVAMGRVAAQDDAALGAMSQVSRALGSRISSDGWARNIRDQVEWRVGALRNGGAR